MFIYIVDFTHISKRFVVPTVLDSWKILCCETFSFIKNKVLFHDKNLFFDNLLVHPVIQLRQSKRISVRIRNWLELQERLNGEREKRECFCSILRRFYLYQ